MSAQQNATGKNVVSTSQVPQIVKRGPKPARIRLSSDDGIEYLVTREKANKFLDDMILWKCDQSDNDPSKPDYVPPPSLTNPIYAAEPPERQGILAPKSTDKVSTLLKIKEIIIAGKENDDNNEGK